MNVKGSTEEHKDCPLPFPSSLSLSLSLSLSHILSLQPPPLPTSSSSTPISFSPMPLSLSLPSIPPSLPLSPQPLSTIHTLVGLVVGCEGSNLPSLPPWRGVAPGREEGWEDEVETWRLPEGDWGNGGAVEFVGVTLCLRRVSLYFCRICRWVTE